MFDTFQGLPVHALVLHATVVLVPLMAVVTVLVAFVPRWRVPAAWPVVAANAVTAATVFVTQQSGEALEERLPRSPAIQRHADLGGKMLVFMAGLLVASILVALVRRRSGAVVSAVGVLSFAAAVAAVVWTVRTGHSGSDAVWKDLISSTNGGG